MSETKLDEQPEEIEMTGEDNIDDPEIEEIENNSADKLKALREKLKACEAEKMEHLEALQRAKAEFLNTRKRLEDERVRDKERAVVTQIEKLLPLCDSFHMAMSNTAAWEAIDENWRSGVEAIHNQLKQILIEYNVAVIDPSNDTFDPNLHEAMGTTDSNAETDTIVQVLQHGYSRNGELIRPAKVILST